MQTSAVMVSHASTSEWQSFEMRMRRRRAERLLLRADVATEAGCLDEAKECLAEVRGLAPSMPGLAEAEAKLLDVAAPPAPVVSPGTRPSAARRIIAAVVSIAALAAVSAWFVQRSQTPGPAQSEPPAAANAPLIGIQPAVRNTQAIPPPSSATAPIEPPHASAPLERIALDRTSSSSSNVPSRANATGPEATRAEASRLDAGPRNPARGEDAGLNAPRPEVPRITASSAADALPGVTTGAPAIPVGAVESREAPAVSTLAPLSMPDPIIPATAPRATITAPTDASQETLVRGVLNRYAAAYSDLDAGAAQRVWPGVNRAALSRAFDALASQRVSFGECRIQVGAATAHAQCAGIATWSPKVGSGGSRTERRNWTFDLARAGSGWQIVGARVQNR